MAEMMESVRAYQRLPFSFANRYKMVLEYQHPERAPLLYYVEPLKATAILEVSRMVKGHFQ